MTTILVVDDSSTIRKLVALTLERHGYQAVMAADGQEALELVQRVPVDLVLLDFVMPKLNGFQFCRELRANPQLAALPVVLMSAKGDKIRGQVVQQTGAVDALTKPFDPRALLAVVETVLRRQREGTVQPARAPSDLDEGPLSSREGLFELGSGASGSAASDHEAQVAESVAAGLCRLVLPLLQQDLIDYTDPGALSQALSAQLTPTRLDKLARLLTGLNPLALAEGIDLNGDLSFLAIAELLQILELQRKSGVLRVRTGEASVAVYMSGGSIDLAQAAGLPTSFRLGHYLVRDAVLTRGDLARWLDPQRTSKGLLGEELVRAKRATAEQVQQALTQQTSELIYETVRWTRGHFTFQEGASCAAAALAQLGLGAAGLLMEGFRRVDEWQLIEDSFDFGDILHQDPLTVQRLAERDPLNDQEHAVLRAVDGRRSVREIIDHAGMGNFEACKALYQLIKARLVRRDAP